MSRYRSNEVRGPIVGFESSNDVPRERLQVRSCKMLYAAILHPKTEKWESVHFQWEYAWLSVWHIISQQRLYVTLLYVTIILYLTNGFKGPPIGNCMSEVQWSRDWWRHWSSISQQPCEVHGQFILTTNRKLHLGNPMVTWPMTSRHVTSKVSVVNPKSLRHYNCAN